MNVVPLATAAPVARSRRMAIVHERALRLAALSAIVLVAALLRFANLDSLGYANHYYTAAVEAMLQSWHNFFFVAAEPGASVSVDKPPVGLWLQAASAYFLGVNTLGVLLPQIIAGLLSVIVIYHLVRRRFGTAAGLLAALAMAITPVVVATDRNNTMDSTLVLSMLLAAWAFIKATEDGRLRYLLLGALMVGVGFNIKMLEAYLPLPAFYALYLLGSSASVRRKLANLALASVLLLAVSLSWAIAVDLTPASERPYVGSSRDNSELSLIVGYNGLNRLLGMNPGGAAGTAPPGVPGTAPNGAFPQDGTRLDGRTTPPGADGAGAPGGFAGTGQPGAMRLFTTPLSKEASWLLPFGLIGMLLVAVRTRLRWPIAPRHQAVVLWGGWLLITVGLFSVAGFFHEYYLSVMAPPLAALFGIGAVTLWQMRSPRAWPALGLLLGITAVTLALQIYTASAYVGSLWWLPILAVLLAAGAALLAIGGSARSGQLPGRLARTGFACVLAAMLVTPGIWSALTMIYSSGNQSLPSAYGGRDQSTGPAAGGGEQINESLLAYLQANTQGMKYLMAVPSSMQGADYVIATGRPVLYLGGFNGQDPVETGDSLARLVSDGELRYVYWSAGGGPGGPGSPSQPGISTWIASQCTVVSGFDTQTRNAGAPDGTGSRSGADAQGGLQAGPGGMQVTLYDCAG